MLFIGKLTVTYTLSSLTAWIPIVIFIESCRHKLTPSPRLTQPLGYHFICHVSKRLSSKRTMDETNFEAQSQSFLAWFKSLPGSTFNDDLLLADLRIRNAGRGIGEFLHQSACLR